jgi:hypothetical protein
VSPIEFEGREEKTKIKRELGSVRLWGKNFVARKKMHFSI